MARKGGQNHKTNKVEEAERGLLLPGRPSILFLTLKPDSRRGDGEKRKKSALRGEKNEKGGRVTKEGSD